MQVKVIDVKLLEKRCAYWGYSVIDANKTTYQVIAIRRQYRKTQYLVEDDMRLFWWDEDLFIVTDYTIPDGWIEIKYKYFHKFQNGKYDFKIPINYYLGPKCFVENKDFMFDIYENPRIAYTFYKT